MTFCTHCGIGGDLEAHTCDGLQIAQLRQECAKSKVALSAANQRLSNVTDVLAATRNAVDELRDFLETANQRIAELTAQLADAKTGWRALADMDVKIGEQHAKELAKAIARAEQAEKDIPYYQAELLIARQEEGKSKDKVSALEESLRLAREEIQKFQSGVAVQQSLNKTLGIGVTEKGTDF
jgi:chromosome segregation ATPase